MRKWNDLYNIGNDYPQYIVRVNKPKPKPISETDIELLFGDNKLIIRLDGTDKKNIEHIEATLTEKE